MLFLRNIKLNLKLNLKYVLLLEFKSLYTVISYMRHTVHTYLLTFTYGIYIHVCMWHFTLISEGHSSVAYSTLIVALPPLRNDTSGPTVTPTTPLTSELVSIQATTGNSLYSGEYSLPATAVEPIYEFPRENLKIEREIGRGEFGYVSLILYCDNNTMIIIR